MITLFYRLSIAAMFLALILTGFYGVSLASAENEATYVGTESCKECHEVEYENFKSFAKKATSYESIKKCGRD